MKIKDMTIGSPLLLVIKFAIPLFIGNIFQQIYTIADIMIAGYKLGDSAIAALGSTSSLYSLIMNIAQGLNGGYAIVVTQKFGSRNLEEFKKATAEMLILNMIGTILLTILSVILLNPMMRFLKTPESIYDQAYMYILIICMGMVGTLAYNMFAGFFRAVGNSSTPLYFLFLSCALNLIMDVLFVVIFEFGVAGAAIATVIAQICSSLLCGVYIWKRYRELLPEKKHFQYDKDLYKGMISAGFSMAMMHCVFSIGSVVLQRAVNSLGDMIITAHTAARRIIEMLIQPLLTLSTATATFIGQNWGARKIDRIKKIIKQTILVGISWGFMSFVVIYLFGVMIVRLMIGTTDQDVISNAVMNLKINFLFFPELGVLLCIRMAMQSMGRKVIPVIASSIELTIKVVTAIFVIPIYGYISASFIEPITWLVCMSFLIVVYVIMRKKIYVKG